MIIATQQKHVRCLIGIFWETNVILIQSGVPSLMKTKKTWITGNCTTTPQTITVDQFSNISFTKILSEQFYIGNSRLLSQSNMQGIDYGSRYTMEMSANSFRLWSTYNGASSFNGRVGRILGSVLSPSTRTLPNSRFPNPEWTKIKNKILSIADNGNLENGILHNELLTEIQNMMIAVDQAQDIIAFVVVGNPFNIYTGKAYPTPFDNIISDFGPVTDDRGDVQGGYVVRLFEIANAVEINNAASCIPLLLTGRSNHCAKCLYSTHIQFSDLVSLLIQKGLLGGIGMAMNLDESPADVNDMLTVMTYYTDQKINVYITALNGTLDEIRSVTKMCIENKFCVSLNLNVAKAGEEIVANTLSTFLHTSALNRSMMVPFCASNNSVLLLPNQILRGTTTNKNNRFGESGNDALFKFRVYPANGAITELEACANNFQTTIQIYSDKAFSSQVAFAYEGFSEVEDCQGSAKVDMELSEGWYYVLVEGLNGTQGEFSISLLFKNTTTGEVLTVGDASHPIANFFTLFMTGIITLAMTF